ncbi:mannose-6-phosphate isomerase, class I [Vibrio sp. SCSIO 43136]|uniref:mannose-6-phosphate isomerase, class I n=1 Tax=Vibrio sp. SCSIO 43136 TaxID=2819101 RepID=UPI00207557EA|nr:mannose-6-phosphate isomerase, class I [Vibrio sp. SCSIO 43136]USD67386.1 mannose-6-phosphate isomerase, class I [Vibrio sp. SCSIO 43136]
MQSTQFQLLDEHRPPFLAMHNVIQNYPWGSKTSLNSLFGLDNPKGEPQAELWMGAHPNGCSKVSYQGEQFSLAKFIQADPSGVLGEANQHFDGLPYLFKVLAAESALSIQVHPNKHQAESGFLREQQAIKPNEAALNYNDPNHKPELVFALTEYHALNGFRAFDEILHFFNLIAIEELQPIVTQFEGDMSSNGLAAFFSALLKLTPDRRSNALSQLIDFAHTQPNHDVFKLILELEKQYPGDIGLFAPLILNLVVLAPGEAMYLAAQTPHAYLRGTGLELMANSDNVLRAGLTNKHIDVDELVACTLFEEKPTHSMLIEPIIEKDQATYPVPANDFKFAVLSSPSSTQVTVTSPEILIALDEELVISHASGKESRFGKGESVFIPAYCKQYEISSIGRVARAYC